MVDEATGVESSETAGRVDDGARARDPVESGEIAPETDATETEGHDAAPSEADLANVQIATEDGPSEPDALADARAVNAAGPAGTSEDPSGDERDEASRADDAEERDAEPTPPASPTGPRTVGRFIADGLRTAGVRYAFTVPGESFLGILEGLRDAGIRVVATRHEGAAAFMAEAHGQLTGRPAVALGTRAVGASNLAIGVHTARQDSAPMFVIVGGVERPFMGREAFQEIDQTETIGRLAALAGEVRDVARLPTLLGDAMRAATTGRPGPAYLAVPEDVIDEEVGADVALDTSRPAPRRPEADEVRSVIQFLATARRPLILAGAGVLRARTSTELLRFAELLRVPVIASWRRGDVISNDHPLYLGMAGFGSPSVVRERLEAADATLVLGSRLSEITTYGYRVPTPGSRWIHVDAEPIASPAGLPAPVAAIQSDARAFLRAAVARLQQGVLDAASADARAELNVADRAAWEAATAVAETEWSGPGVHPGNAVAAARRILPDDAIVTTDAGNFGLWIARHFRFRRPGTFLGPTSGAMGYALPAAIAAALVHRERPVVAFAGDGGFAMTMAELETAVREGARVIAVVFDNERYGTIRMHQDRRARETERAIATDLGPVDFAAIARACGARGIRVETDAAFEGALRQALANDRATVIQVALDRGWVHPDRPYGASGTAGDTTTV